MNHDGRTPWTRQLLVGLGALLAVALVVAGVVGAFALGANTVRGTGDSSTAASTSPSRVDPGESPSREPRPTASSSGAPVGGSPTRQPTSGAAITLRATPASVRADQRITLTGVVARGGGATLQVQRFEGRWADFPVRVSVDGRRFSSSIQSSRTGSLRFRVVDPATGRVSNPVRVRIG